MSTQSEGPVEDGNQRKKSISSGGRGSSVCGPKTRRYTIGVVTTTPKTNGNLIPNYLRASTGSCHDFCKYGHKNEQSKSPIPVKFKRTKAVDTYKVIKFVVPVETKKTTPVVKVKPFAEPSEVNKNDISVAVKKAEVSKRSASTNVKATRSDSKTVQRSTSLVRSSRVTASSDGSGGSNGGIKKKDLTAVKKTLVTPKTAAIKKVLNESSPTKPVFGRGASSKAIKHKSSKQVDPLNDETRLLKADFKQTISDKVQTENLNAVEPESEIKPDAVEFDLTHPDIDLTHLDNDFIVAASESFSGTYVVDKELTEAESKYKPETDEFDLTHPDIDFIHSAAESFSGKNVVEEELVIGKPVNESADVDEELLEVSSAATCAVESSRSCSDKDLLEEEFAHAVSESSESFYDEEVIIEYDSEYTDDEEVEVFESEISNNDKMETIVGSQNKISRKGRMLISEDKDDEAVKLRFRRGKILDIKSENNGPRRLKFRKARIVEGKDVKQHFGRRSFEKKYIKEISDSNVAVESVVLKHQGEQGKKDAQGLFNNVIEETASKLTETRKSKVKALVGAFETVISLQDRKL
ncbi:uncharacterized protein [Rutidosis leptorrhynchoides]|uniref:uncharacterized protein n=1 Tax=Rutidosis leptorrhynchoides TaxID=125765 RepID=UPI003A9934DC